MPLSRRCAWLLVALVCSLPLLPDTASAQEDLVPGAWTVFEWFAPGAVEGEGFFLHAIGRTRLRVTDERVAGDIFDLFINGARFATSSSVTSGVDTGLFDGESAWADPRLSKAEIFLDPGEYLIELAVTETPDGWDFGEGFLRADPAGGPVGVAPEPVSMILLGTGLLGLGAARRRRRARAPAD